MAGILEIARRLSGQALSRTIRFVAFVNEEPPFFQTHTAQDTPDKIDYEKMTRVVLSVQKMLEVLAYQGKP